MLVVWHCTVHAHKNSEQMKNAWTLNSNTAIKSYDIFNLFKRTKVHEENDKMIICEKPCIAGPIFLVSVAVFFCVYLLFEKSILSQTNVFFFFWHINIISQLIGILYISVYKLMFLLTLYKKKISLDLFSIVCSFFLFHQNRCVIWIDLVSIEGTPYILFISYEIYLH